jgi:hypothetical protein
MRIEASVATNDRTGDGRNEVAESGWARKLLAHCLGQYFKPQQEIGVAS